MGRTCGEPDDIGLPAIGVELNGSPWHHRFPQDGGSNFPLRGNKATVFEGGVRSIAFASGAGIPAARKKREEYFSGGYFS